MIMTSFKSQSKAKIKNVTYQSLQIMQIKSNYKRKLEYQGKNFSQQSRELTTQSTYGVEDRIKPTVGHIQIDSRQQQSALITASTLLKTTFELFYLFWLISGTVFLLQIPHRISICCDLFIGSHNFLYLKERDRKNYNNSIDFAV